MPRYAKVTIVLGKKKSGKTNKTLGMIYDAVRAGRKALIFDSTDEFGNYIYRPNEPAHSIKAIYLRDIPRFSAQTFPEVVRIRPYWDDGKRMGNEGLQQALSKILDTYCNGILLLEDINKYIPDNAPNDLIGSLATVRQAGVDVIIHYQLVEKAGNPKLLGNCSYIRLHKTVGRVERHADKYLDKTEILSIAETIVDARFAYGIQNNIKDRTGQFFSVTVDVDETFKISGIFTQKEAEAAIQKYISKNHKDTVGSLQNQRDRYGNFIYKDYGQAYAQTERRVLSEYFSFK